MVARAWVRRNVAQVCEVRCGAGSMPASLRISPDGRGGDRDAQREEFAVDSAVSPGAVLVGQVQRQDLDGADGGWSSDSLGAGDYRVAVGGQVTVPAQYGFGACQQPDTAQYLAG
jgi:hypothetical protein